MGTCDSCCGEKEPSFTALAELHNKQQRISGHDEVQFHYDPRSQRLVPIVHHDASNQRAMYRSTHSVADSDSLNKHRSPEHDGRNDSNSLGEGSMVDCVSNNSFDYDFGDNNTSARIWFDELPQNQQQQQRKNSVTFSGSKNTVLLGSDTTPGTLDDLLRVGRAAAAAGATASSSGDGADSDRRRDTESPTPASPSCVDMTPQSLQELEEISRSEIYAAFMVAIQMLRFAEKKIAPTMRLVAKKSPAAAAAAAPLQPTQQQQQLPGGKSPLQQQEQQQQLVQSDVKSRHRRHISNLATSTVITFVSRDLEKHLEGKRERLFSSTADNSRMMMTMQSAGTPSDAAGSPGRQGSYSQDRLDGSAGPAPAASASSAASPMTPAEKAFSEPGSATLPPPADAKVQAAAPEPAAAPQRVELLELDARRIPSDGSKVKCHNVPEWDFFREPQLATKLLNAGDVLFAFKAYSGDHATDADLSVTTPIINLSCFKDETVENNVPRIDLRDPKESKKFTVIVSKLLYLVPELEAKDVDPAIWSSRKYCEGCISGGCTFEDTLPTDVNTFRMHKPLLKYIYSMIVQLKLSDVTDPKVLAELGKIDGFVPVRALLYERTKRDKTKTDSTVKQKAVLMFHPVPGGMIVATVVCVLTSAIPKFLTGFVSNMGSSGAAESAENVQMTRKFVMESIVVPRRLREQQEQLLLQQQGAPAAAASASSSNQ